MTRFSLITVQGRFGEYTSVDCFLTMKMETVNFSKMPMNL
jgi:hypothetical protein